MSGKKLGAGLLLASLVLAFPSASLAEGEELTFRWALGAAAGKGKRPLSIERDTKVQPGTRLKFLMEPKSTGAFYLILFDSDNELHVLFRETGSEEPSYIPPDPHWFQVDSGTGRETFFLLASAEPLAKLESLLEEYAAAGLDAREAATRNVIGEIRSLQRANRDFADAVEKPVLIGGQTRGDDDTGIDPLATEVTASGFYSKTITIEH